MITIILCVIAVVIIFLFLLLHKLRGRRQKQDPSADSYHVNEHVDGNVDEIADLNQSSETVSSNTDSTTAGASPNKRKRTKSYGETTQKTKPIVSERNTTAVTIRKMSVIWKRPNEAKSCYRCNSLLQSETVLVATYPVAHFKGDNIKYIKSEVMACSACRYVCMDENKVKEIKGKLNGYWIDFRLWEIEEPKMTKILPATDNNKSDQSFKWPSTYAVETLKPGNSLDFDKESNLHQLGYRISGITRHRRWWILENEALPKLGLELVANTIAANVRIRKRQKGGIKKYSYAIKEWEHDMEELKKHYYKRDFTWPHTN